MVKLRVRLQLSGDDLLEVMQRCMESTFSRSALFRALRRNGVSRLPSVKEARSYQAFDVELSPGFMHADVKYLTKLKGKRSYVYVGIDRATRHVHIQINDNLRPATADGFVEEFSDHCGKLGIVVGTILSDNGVE